MYPIKDKDKYKVGYHFGVPTFYSNFHLGIDALTPENTPVYAPFNGTVTKTFGPSGGLTVHFRPDDRNDLIRFLHLNSIIKTGKVAEGDLVAYTGGRKGNPNAGNSTSPHIHIDIWDLNKGALNIYDTTGFKNPETYEWHMDSTLKVQLVFNNQQYTNEYQAQVDTTARMLQLSAGKIVLNFLSPLYTHFTNIPAKVHLDTTGQQDTAVDKDWFIEHIWSLNKTADVVILVGKAGDWQNTHDNITTYGHYYSELPATFPALIQIVAGETDKSWKWPQLSAFVHYVTHEVSHALFQNALAIDQTHLYDYAAVDGLAQVLPSLDFNKINYQLTHKISYDKGAIVFIQKENDSTIFLNEGDVLIPFSATFEHFLADFPNAKVIILSPNEFLKLRIANNVIIKDR